MGPQKVPNYNWELRTQPNQKLTIGRTGDGRPRGGLQDGLVGIIAGGRSGGGRGSDGGRRSGGLGPEPLVVVELVDDGGLDDGGGFLGSFAAGHGSLFTYGLGRVPVSFGAFSQLMI